MAKPAIDQQASTAGKCPGRHRQPEKLRFEISNLKIQISNVGMQGIAVRRSAKSCMIRNFQSQIFNFKSPISNL
jgi:hypothetical protein